MKIEGESRLQDIFPGDVFKVPGKSIYYMKTNASFQEGPESPVPEGTPWIRCVEVHSGNLASYSPTMLVEIVRMKMVVEPS